jgi:hypothetical protein
MTSWDDFLDEAIFMALLIPALTLLAWGLDAAYRFIGRRDR